MKDDYIEDVIQELWQENFEDLPEKINSYLNNAILKKYDGISFCGVYPTELESAVENVMSDFASLIRDNLEELELSIQEYFDSLSDTTEEFDGEDEKWKIESNDEIDLGLDRI